MLPPPTVRRLLHVAHALASLVLVATGFLIGWPDLRARIVGGYGRQLLDVHNWSGVLFMVAPALALAFSLRPLWSDLVRRLGPAGPGLWKRSHIAGSVIASFALSVSGILLWVDWDLPLAVLDASLAVHMWLAWLFAVVIPIHIVVSRRKIRARLMPPWGAAPHPEPGEGFPEGEPP